MADAKWCLCPTGLGYRFHRHPCALAGEVEELVLAPGEGGADRG